MSNLVIPYLTRNLALTDCWSMRSLTNYKLLDDIMLELARVRATAMDCSFGTQKEYYDLKRVKARTKLTEILYIRFASA